MPYLKNKNCESKRASLDDQINQISDFSSQGHLINLRLIKLFNFKMIAFLFVVALILALSVSALVDKHESCQFWADEGECTSNPNYMVDSMLD